MLSCIELLHVDILCHRMLQDGFTALRLAKANDQNSAARVIEVRSFVATIHCNPNVPLHASYHASCFTL